MALKKRGKVWSIFFRPFKGDRQLVWVSTNTALKTRAEEIERQILVACRAWDYRALDPEARAICLSMFRNRGLSIPEDLGTDKPHKKVVTLWEGIRFCLTYPGIQESRNSERHEQAFVHIVRIWGKDRPIDSIKVQQIREYQIRRQSEKAAASTINKERAALSKMFQALVESGIVGQNPVKDVRGLSESDGEREVYIGFSQFSEIVTNLPTWLQPIIQTLYFTGMRRGEALGLTWEDVDLDSRIIRLDADRTKEHKRKRIPIHRLLVPILERQKKIRSLSSNRIFVMSNGKPPSEDSLRKPWVQTMKALKISPVPSIHDVRHVWSTNAMRSGMDYEIREAILGHATKAKDVSRRYIMINDADLLRGIDRMSFDHGETQIWLPPKKEKPEVTASGQVWIANG